MNGQNRKFEDLLRVFLRENPAAKAANTNQTPQIETDRRNRAHLK
jgi:hypothetical protein